ncbi:glycoside hydrolase family 5 protein [Exidia glandulosa HHB12029]|uniref:Glycoside hydrolase family 5 protein n=1 Tax=Exidia glandulosa HHB12029 TaxID=1314781 RepID=A0A165FVV2_EXIGL|nr:glycoside hydrolase family 5 protein [Exidia glandulosa HHB12029]
MLRVSGTKIVDKDGEEVMLRGAGVGGWMHMENFITGFPGHECQIREALDEAIGKEDAAFFFDKFLEYFITEADVKFYKSLGLNCLRIAFHYAHFEDDMNPRVLKESGFKPLDRVIDLCAKHEIYVVLDMHAVPGGQSPGWHADNAAPQLAEFWRHADFQNRAIWLWEQIAARYKDNAWIAGYNPLNEPAVKDASKLVAWYDKVHDAIRAVDTNHILFFDGNTFASDFSQFPDEAHKNWTNAAFSIHDYAVFGFPSSPEPYSATPQQLLRLKKTFEKKQAWMVERGLAVWNGEFGPVYARAEVEGSGYEEINERRLHVLRDQLQLYEEAKVGWSIWLYKDVGFQGMTFVDRSTPYMQLMQSLHAKKQRLVVDEWGADDSKPEIRAIYEPLEKLIEANVEEKYRTLYPMPHWTLRRRVARFARNTLVAEFLVQEWADLFRGKTRQELDDIAASFKFENCVQRMQLNDILQSQRVQ